MCKMKRMLSCLLLISIPALISSDFIITESEHHKSDYVNPLPNVPNLAGRTVKKRSTEQHDKKSDLQIYSMKIESKVTSRFAHTVVISRVVNRANMSKEAFFEMELPKTAFITNFSMSLDGVTYVGAVKEKEAAQQQYQQAVSRGQTAGLVKVSGRKMEKFQVSVNIGPTKKVTFELTYEELLKRNLGKYEMHIRVKPQQLVKHFQIDVHIFEPQGIAFLNVDAKFLPNNLTSIVKQTLSDTKAHVSFKPTLEQQRKCPDCHETILDGDFIVIYDVNRDLSAGSVQIVNGYFVHHFAPANLSRIPKNVIFVIDHSGSMRGTKMHQTNEALVKILDDLDTKDHFAIIIFDHSFKTWRSSIFQATPANVTEAKTFVQTISARGGTNINDPMLEAVKRLDQAYKEKLLPERSVSMIILLTDGDPNEGESNPTQIQKNVKNAVNGKYNVYCLGFGYDVKFSFLEKMALENSGIARRIYEDSDAPLQLQDFFDEVANPLLLDIEFQYPESVISGLTKSSYGQLYGGSEFVMAGKVLDNNIELLRVEVFAQTANENLTLQTEVKVSEAENITQQQQYIFGDFTERLWAYLTIQQLLEKRISAETNEKKSVTDQILELSLKYSFVTPLTSMVVTKPEENKNDTFVADKPSDDDEPFRLPQKFKTSRGHQSRHSSRKTKVLSSRTQTLTGPVHSARLHLHGFYGAPPSTDIDGLTGFPGMAFRTPGRLQDLFGMPIYATDIPIYATDIPISATVGASVYGLVDSDPHFIISINDHSDAICFNIDGKPGAILNVVTDPSTGFVINGQLIGEKKIETNKKINTYFGKFGIVNDKTGVKVEVSTQTITVFHGEDKIIFPWSATAYLARESFSISIVKEKNLTLTMGDDATFVIVLHRVWKNHPLHRDFLGFYTLDSHRLSNRTHGLIGQFYHEVNAEIYNIRPGLDQGKPDATMIVKGHKLRVTRGNQKDYRLDPKRGTNIPCWFVHYNGKGLIDGIPTDYVVTSLFDSLYS
ncbi:inter-alpha-trypsin inhibitor heavy chain H3-like isoform X5 [Scyliorhinus canicula]|uniref:inter-alpha-trypsin inhibitor heavy chain H3-like isoform X3 n=1 Tax=Scyliorhinus canicula TaxID=7830 RepID=UPI0018F2C601|nr:inter-alpha-trypsin inhibitor heavy chain H3-like isoform X3 [Scyliorhinus canicula]XP_038668469.1 inter-alpha-trypsin inhibitor heavy chain H3-like isoform X5 [Scyliorhinus canicula]